MGSKASKSNRHLPSKSTRHSSYKTVINQSQRRANVDYAAGQKKFPSKKTNYGYPDEFRCNFIRQNKQYHKRCQFKSVNDEFYCQQHMDTPKKVLCEYERANDNVTIFDNITVNTIAEHPLTHIDVITSNNEYDKAQRAAYINGYKTGCSNYVKYINNKLKNSYYDSFIEVFIDVNNGNELIIPGKYNNSEYNKELIKKVSNYICAAYKHFGITVKYKCDYSIALVIDKPFHSVTSFQTLIQQY